MSLTTIDEAPPKKPSIIVTAGAIAVLSLLGIGGGWVGGNMPFLSLFTHSRPPRQGMMSFAVFLM